MKTVMLNLLKHLWNPVRPCLWMMSLLAATTAALAAPPAEVPARVRVIVAPATNETFRARLNAVHALGKAMTAEESQAVGEYLRTRSDPESPGRQMENWLRNDIMDKLVEQDTPPPGLAALLVGIYEDRQQDVVMRDYAVQHITPAYAQCSPEERAALHAALWNAAQEKDSSIAGTALIALEDLSSGRARPPGAPPVEGDFDRSRIQQTALQLAGDKTCGDLSRITALSICARMGEKRVAPIAAQLAQDEQQSIPLRIAAIAALGDVGGGSALGVFEQIAAGADARLKHVAQATLERAKKRGTK